jgi:hypothetical protein
MKLRNYKINRNAMKKLKETCSNKPLFKKELERIIGSTNRHDLLYVLKYCYDNYSDMHPDVLLEVYNDRIKNISKESQVHAHA